MVLCRGHGISWRIGLTSYSASHICSLDLTLPCIHTIVSCTSPIYSVALNIFTIPWIPGNYLCHTLGLQVWKCVMQKKRMTTSEMKWLLMLSAFLFLIGISLWIILCIMIRKLIKSISYLYVFEDNNLQECILIWLPVNAVNDHLLLLSLPCLQ